MQVVVQKRAEDDAKGIKNKTLIQELLDFIADAQRCSDVSELTNYYDFSALEGDSSYYRLRIGNYRVGCRVDASQNKIVIMRILHRAEIYQKFP